MTKPFPIIRDVQIFPDGTGLGMVVEVAESKLLAKRFSAADLMALRSDTYEITMTVRGKQTA